MKIILGLFLCLGLIANSFGASLPQKTSDPDIAGTVTDSHHKFVPGARVMIFSATGRKF